MRRVSLIVALFGLAFLSGCMASFSERPAFPTYSGPPTPLPVRLQASGKDFLHLPPDQWMEAPISSSLANVASDAIFRSGWVQAAAESDGVTELGVYVAHYQGSGPGLLSTLTAFLIPGIVDHRIDVKVRLVRPGHVPRECVRSTETRTWYQTFLLFVYPFRSPAYGRIRSSEALALSCVAELLQQDAVPTAI